ncbi:MAG: AraC family transcriptional regulator [Cyanobacteria bacterium P01_E01_bin.42]
MTITFRDDEFRQILSDCARNTQPELLSNERDRTVIFPDWLGEGYVRDIRLRGGLSLTLHRNQLKEDIISLTPEFQRKCFEFSFFMNAKAEIDGQLYTVEQQVFLVNSTLPASRIIEFAGEPLWAIDVHLDKSALASMVAEYEPDLPSDVRCMVMGESDRVALQPLKITATMQNLLQQIMQCPYQGLTRSLYLESKSLELIALYIQGYRDNLESLPRLRADDLDGIHQAREILCQNLHAPPSIAELARRVGMNTRKLKQGFRELFDTTVFGYLTQQRMAIACQLLQQQWSVAATAAKVGYNSPTAFSGAFRRKFGMPPKAYQLSNGRGA